MKLLGRVISMLLAVLLAALPVTAQDQDDRRRLERLLEQSLSDSARIVRVEGFSGALSSSATLERMTIADDQGIWLTLEDAHLDWSRAALFQGELKVDRLTASTLRLDRLPGTEPSTPSAEATPFSLPELPVSISLADLAIDRVSLGEDVLGQAVDFTISGAAFLQEGQGGATLTLDRIDGPHGAFALTSRYSNQTGILELALSLSEQAGGIAVSLLQLPGAPSIDLDIRGTGPLSDFAADIRLASDGQPRLTGAVKTSLQADMRHAEATLSGDIRPLLPPDYHPFFGPALDLSVAAQERADGGWQVDDLNLNGGAFQFMGTLALDANGLPEQVQIDGRIASPSGNPVLLPVSGADTRIQAVDLMIRHNRDAGPEWVVTSDFADLASGDLRITSAGLSIDGILSPDDGGAVSADIAVSLMGIDTGDSALNRALGPQVTLSGDVDWRAGNPFQMSDLQVSTDTMQLAGTASTRFSDMALDTDFNLTASVPDLSPFSQISGQDLSGSVRVQLAGQVDPLSGAFAVTATGQAIDPLPGAGIPARLVAGETDLRMQLTRDISGVTLEVLTLDGQKLTARASGILTSGDSSLTASATMHDASILNANLPGAISTVVAVSREGAGPWSVDIDAHGVGGLVARMQGDVFAADDVDLAITGTIPLGLADPLIAPRSVRGDLNAELTLRGAPGLAALSGVLTANSARVVAPTLGLAFEETDLDIRLSGGTAQLRAITAATSGGRLQAEGQIGLTGAQHAELSVNVQNLVLEDPTLFQTVVNADNLRLSGPIAGGGMLSGRLILGQTDLRIPDPTAGTAEAIPEITHLGEPAMQRLSRRRAGLLGTGGGSATAPINLDLTISAPGRIFLRGRGLDAELGGMLQISGTSENVIPSGRFELIRGRMDLLGRRLSFTEGSASLSGSFDPVLRLVAESEIDDIAVSILISGPASAPDLSLTSTPELPEDEILSRFIFGRDVASLSAFQALKLAQGAATLTGRGGNGILSRLRNALGLDDLDVTSTDEGGTTVSAGRYIRENIYSKITVEQDGTSTVSLNIDLTPDITATGQVTSDGESSLGVFYERDY